ncbi:MAG: GWxTD domain-containing protein [Flavobacteriales bacterium]|nr:GWxTD domain-containing protein [Flavobacteriales bacterium]
MRAIWYILPLVFTAWPYRPVKAQVQVVVESRTFYAATGQAQTEVNMAFLAGTMAAKANDRGFMQAKVEALTLIEQGGAVKAFAKTEVLGPERLDSVEQDLVHQEFFALEPGVYDLSIEVRDLVSGDTVVTRYAAPLAVGTAPPALAISNILLAERIQPSVEGERSKYGYTVVPLLTDHLPKSVNKLSLYAEVYNSDQQFGTDSLYLLSYQIEELEKKRVFGPYKRSTRAKARPVEPVMAEFDIAQLPSGNYVASVEVRDRTGMLLSRSEQSFQRNNPISYNYDLQSLDRLDLEGKFTSAFANTDSLAEHIASLRPIADPLERKIIDDRWKDRDLDLMKRFFYTFWANRGPEPEKAWHAYQQEVIKVNKMFGCRLLKGYETDRGRVYLKYGPPNTMMDRFNEMGTLPYSIWHYYNAGRFANRRFVFYQPDMAMTCLQLLHSEVPGEPNNPQWMNILHARNNAFPGVQSTDPGTLESDRVRELYNDPR